MNTSNNTAPPLRLTSVPAGRGLLWVRQGFRVFMKKPLALSGLLATVVIAMLLLSLIPGIGAIVLLVYPPILTLIFMMATQTVLKGGTPMPVQLIVPLRADVKRRNALLKLGATYAVATVIVFLLVAWVDGGAMDSLWQAVMKNDAEAASEAFGDSRLQFGILVRLVLVAVLSIPYWHAAALIWWGGQGVRQSLFSSTLACWGARGAFAVYGLVWGAISFVCAFVLMTVAALIGGEGLAVAVMIPSGLIFWTAFYSSLYFTFVDSFSAVPAAD